MERKNVATLVVLAAAVSIYSVEAYYDYDYDYWMTEGYDYDDGDDYDYRYYNRYKLPGSWVDAPLEVLGDHLLDFEQGLFSITSMERALDRLGCSRYGNYLVGVFVNLDDDNEMVLEVYCDYRTSYLRIGQFPPATVEMFRYKPVDEVY